MRLTFPIAVFALASTLAAGAHADVVTDWNKSTVDEIRKLGLGPNPATRALAITHIAVFDAVNAITRSHQPYHALLTVTSPASPEAAAASAAYQALVLQFPNEKATLDAQLTESLSTIPDGPAKQHGIEIGKAAAVDIFTLRIGDGSSGTGTYPSSTDAGKWRPTPRADLSTPLAALEPWWRFVTPFALTSPAQFRPAAPPPITSAAFATAYQETKSLGKIDSPIRTADQTQVANFWKQATHVPFNAIARSVSNLKALTVEQNARLFALLNITLADTRIAVWDAKYEYGYWRPITAINTDTDYGNAAVQADTSWLPLLETPNHPEYPSGHSTTGGGGARLLENLFGSDAVSFAVSSDTLLGVVRGFTKFSEAEQENADSRVYAGIHYRFSNEAGIALGHQVADYVTSNYLKPLATPVTDGGAGGEAGQGAAGESSSAGSAGANLGSGGAPETGGGGESGGTLATAGETSGAEAGEGGLGPSGGKGGSSGGGAGKPPVPPLSADDDEDTSCAVAQPGGAAGQLGVGLLLAVVGAGLRLRRRRNRR